MIDTSRYPWVQRLARELCGHEEGGASPPLPREEPLDDTYKQALKRLQNPDALASSTYWKRRDAVDWSVCHDEIRDFALRFTALFARYQVPVFVHGAFRSGAEQDRLFAQGVTKARAGHSAHNYGAAVDIVHFGHYWDLTRKEWDLFGALGKDVAATSGLKVTWGGDFKSIWDPAHWELSDWRQRGLPRG